MSHRSRPRYLFVRLLEACNANCFMCGFARSAEPFRLAPDELATLCRAAASAGVRFVRFTGGEPLMHAQIGRLVEIVATAGLRCSVITNGYWLEERLEELAAAGLEQVIVSLDASSATLHDRVRRTHGLFARATRGLQAAAKRGLRVRVNTVAGPHNFREMPRLKRRLAAWGAGQWELSALKLEQPTRYRDRAAVLSAGAEVYDRSFPLVPMGVPWYGETPEEQDRYFLDGIPPRPRGPVCHVTGDVVYLDARRRELFACSCLPHRSDARFPAPVGDDLGTVFTADPLGPQREHYHRQGPSVCTGCSATAAGFSNQVEAGLPLQDWDY